MRRTYVRRSEYGMKRNAEIGLFTKPSKLCSESNIPKHKSDKYGYEKYGHYKRQNKYFIFIFKMHKKQQYETRFYGRNHQSNPNVQPAQIDSGS
jgi:hypothetical protein